MFVMSILRAVRLLAQYGLTRISLAMPVVGSGLSSVNALRKQCATFEQHHVHAYRVLGKNARRLCWQVDPSSSCLTAGVTLVTQFTDWSRAS